MARVAWVIWFAVWALLAVPWRTLGSVPHPERIVWLVPVRPRDALLNLAFYLPMGALGARAGWGVPRTLSLAAAISILTEVLQVFAPRRWPATSDIVMNLAGALTGFAAAYWLSSQAAKRRTPSA